MKSSAFDVVDVPSAVETVTSTVPGASAGDETVIVVAVMDSTVAGLPPKSTIAPAVNPVPVIVTSVPPLARPLFGDTALTVGAE